MYDQADLEKRSKALDLREALLEQKAQQLDEQEANSKIAVLTKQISAKEAVVDKLNDKILALDDEFETKAADVTARLKTLHDQASSKAQFIDNLNAKKTELDTALSNLKADLKAINDQVKERQDYLSNQEQVVEQTIGDWNELLTDYQSRANGYTVDKDKVLTEIVRLEQQRTSLANDIDTLATKLDSLTFSYQDKVSAFKDQLRQLDQEVRAKQQLLAELDIHQQLRENNLVAREKSVKVKEVTQRRTEQELTQRERKLKMDYNLAGEVYE